jgi:hypothetical protein
VLVALVAGGLIWHEKPSFCNAICHSPMDRYVKGYYSGDAKLLITKHAKSAECLDCHKPTLSQQLSEAAKWITKNYSDPLEKRKLATRAFCLTEGCHVADEVASKTENYGGSEGVNPHASHQGDLDCYHCHSMHGTSTLFCNKCHSMDLPDGWTECTETRRSVAPAFARHDGFFPRE